MNKLRTFIAVWREAQATIAKRRAEQNEADIRAGIAQAFNDLFTYRREWVKGLPRLSGSGLFGFTVNGGYAWMCPDCNKIHMATEQSVFDGIHYPACCRYPAGNRCGYGIKADDKGMRA